MFFLGLIGLLLMVDLALKAEIESRDGTEFPRKLDEKGRIILHRSHNAGLPFGLLKQYREAVLMIPVMAASAVAGILFWLLQKKGHLTEKLGFSLVLAGALSNLWDRASRKYVVDYFSINRGCLRGGAVSGAAPGSGTGGAAAQSRAGRPLSQNPLLRCGAK